MIPDAHQPSPVNPIPQAAALTSPPTPADPGQRDIRWFTSTKLWRAFPELDPFSDEQCRPVITFVSRSSLDQLCCIGLVLLGTLVSGFLLVGFLPVVQHAFNMPQPHRSYELPLALLFTIGMGTLPFVGVLRVRDMLLRHHLRKLLTNGSTCASCSYSLLGLPLDEHHRTTCPECGTVQDVHKAFASLAPDTQPPVTS